MNETNVIPQEQTWSWHPAIPESDRVKPSELLRETVKAWDEVKQLPDVEMNMEVFHDPVFDDKPDGETFRHCRMCLAGALMHQRENLNLVDWASSGNYARDYKQNGRVVRVNIYNAIDYYRMGSLALGEECLGIFSSDRQSLLGGGVSRRHPRIEESPSKFRQYILNLADEYEGVGL